MKRSIILFCLILTLSNVFSQKFSVNGKDTFVTITKADFITSIAKMNEGYYYKVESFNCKNLTWLMQKSIDLRTAKISVQDSLILNYDQQLQHAIKQYNTETGLLQDQLNKHKKQSMAMKYISVGLVGIIISLLILK